MCSGSTTCCATTSPRGVHQRAGGVLQFAHDGGEAGAEQRVLHLLHDAGERGLHHFEIDGIDLHFVLQPRHLLRRHGRTVRSHPLTRASMRPCDKAKSYELILRKFIMDCRVTGERSDAVLRTAMPGNDAAAWIDARNHQCSFVTIRFFHSSTRAIWPGTDHSGAVELIEHRRPRERRARRRASRADRPGNRGRAVEAHAPRLAQRVGQRAALALEARHLHRRHEADAAHAIGHDLDRLLRRGVAEHGAMLRVERPAQIAPGRRRSIAPAAQGMVIS